MTDKEINRCPNININKNSKEMIEDYIRNIAKQEIIKDKIYQVEFERAQNNINFGIWRSLNGK